MDFLDGASDFTSALTIFLMLKKGYQGGKMSEFMAVTPCIVPSSASLASSTLAQGISVPPPSLAFLLNHPHDLVPKEYSVEALHHCILQTRVYASRTMTFAQPEYALHNTQLRSRSIQPCNRKPIIHNHTSTHH